MKLDSKAMLVLQALGMAWYIHYRLMKRAEKASEAVDYLAEQGVFGKD